MKHDAQNIAVAVALLGSAIAFLGIAVSLYIRWRNSRDTARATLRAAFAQDLEGLRSMHVTGLGGQVWNLLRHSYVKHDSAVVEFRHALGPIGRYFLCKRWRAYRGPDHEEEDGEFRLTHFLANNHSTEEAQRSRAIALITALIS